MTICSGLQDRPTPVSHPPIARSIEHDISPRPSLNGAGAACAYSSLLPVSPIFHSKRARKGLLPGVSSHTCLSDGGGRSNERRADR